MGNFGKPKIPAPFQRPSIELSAAGKEWQHVTSDKISVGDIIAGKGLVTSASENGGAFSGWTVEAGGSIWYLRDDEAVFAFTAKRAAE